MNQSGAVAEQFRLTFQSFNSSIITVTHTKSRLTLTVGLQSTTSDNSCRWCVILRRPVLKTPSSPNGELFWLRLWSPQSCLHRSWFIGSGHMLVVEMC